MGGVESDTIGGYNAFLRKQKKDKELTTITTVLFDDNYELLHNGIDILNVDFITSKDYFVRGSTALLDAIGKTIANAKRRVTNSKKSEETTNVIFVIITDGMENASQEYSFRSIKKLIDQQKEAGWEFVFLGADLTNSEDAEKLGLRREKQAYYSKENTVQAFNAMSDSVSMFKIKGKLDVDWANDIDENKK